MRKSLLKRQCVHNVINILISTTISLMTRDIIVKFPTILLKEMYNALGIDISDNERTNLLFLIHEILYQRIFKPTECNLYEGCLSATVRSCGHLTYVEISYLFRNFNSHDLDTSLELFSHNYWSDIISKIKSERGEL